MQPLYWLVKLLVIYLHLFGWRQYQECLKSLTFAAGMRLGVGLVGGDEVGRRVPGACVRSACWLPTDLKVKQFLLVRYFLAG